VEVILTGIAHDASVDPEGIAVGAIAGLAPVVMISTLQMPSNIVRLCASPPIVTMAARTRATRTQRVFIGSATHAAASRFRCRRRLLPCRIFCGEALHAPENAPVLSFRYSSAINRRSPSGQRAAVAAKMLNQHAHFLEPDRAQQACAGEESQMPKLKTKSGAKKRFKMTASGRVKAGVAGKRHRLLNHSANYIRQNRGTKILAKGDESLVKWYMPYNR
jgi:large subunit ribosomal protein L35